MAEAPNTTNPSRRLFLATGPAAAVFGTLSAAAKNVSNGPLLFACRRALAAHQAYHDLSCEDADDNRLELWPPPRTKASRWRSAHRPLAVTT